jgi:hypothetical protein
MAKFKCINNDCSLKDVEQFYSEYSVTVRYNTLWFFDKTQKRIMCKECETPLERIDEDCGGKFSVNIALFGSKSPQEKRDILKKRANDTFNSSKEMQEYRDAAEKEEL